MSYRLKDERGVLIEEWDIIRVFHYVSERRKVYMYKQVRRLPDEYLVGHHLNGGFNASPGSNSWYFLTGDKGLNKGMIEGTRIVQSNNWKKL